MNIYTLIVFLPLLGFLVAGLFGKVIGVKASEYLTSGLLLISAALSWVVFYQIGLSGHPTGPKSILLLHWLTSGNLNLSWSIRVDTLTAVMLVVVTSVSSLVHVYSIGYMHNDPHRQRFFAYLSLFTFAMLMLVTADNFMQMFFGWEGVGLASYLLIGFWYHKPAANAAAIKAFVVNRVGDFGFALGIFAIFFIFGSMDFDTVFAAAKAQEGLTMQFLSWEFDVMTVICLLLFMGAMGKSAQLLLHTWLPDAMEGPTPVSALIHAATMVTAGVFMVARLSPLFELSPTALQVVTFVGASTAIFAATVGVTQNDIKRVVAYSTCSQLGYMFVALGVGAYGAGIFHLFTHAFFKALLFLGSGAVIHAVSDEQDMRKMGGLAKKIPYTYAMMIIGTIALTGVGIPTIIGTAGFYSKDAIIESAFAAHSWVGNYAFWMTVAAAFLTSFYSWRLIFMTFHGPSRVEEEAAKHIHESPNVMLIPLYLLAVGALAAGFVFKDFFIGHDPAHFWGKSISDTKEIVAAMHHVPMWVKLSPFVMMVAGFFMAWLFYIQFTKLPALFARVFRPIYLFSYNKWYFDELYNLIFIRPAMWLGRLFWKGGDGKIIDGLGPDGIAARVLDITKGATRMQTGYVYHYAFVMLIGLAAIISWFMFGDITGATMSGGAK